jgi:hypothetical protein
LSALPGRSRSPTARFPGAGIIETDGITISDSSITNGTYNQPGHSSFGSLDDTGGGLSVTDTAFSNDPPPVLKLGPAGATGSLSGLNLSGITGGQSSIENGETLSIANSTFSNDTVQNVAVGFEAGIGGVVTNTGTVTVTGSTFSGDQGTGIGTDRDIGGPGAFSGAAGAISNGGTATVTDTTFSGDSAPDPDVMEAGAVATGESPVNVNEAPSLTLTSPRTLAMPTTRRPARF